MSRLGEPLAWFLAIALLLGGVVVEGRRRVSLEARVPVGAKELYGLLARSQVRYQIVDVRADLAEGYEDDHIPGAVPMPECDPEKTPKAARDRILPSVPTIIVSEEGDAAAFARCAARFTTARNLGGGMKAWDDANLPEDTGEYTPPSSRAGGGCL